MYSWYKLENGGVFALSSHVRLTGRRFAPFEGWQGGLHHVIFGVALPPLANAVLLAGASPALQKTYASFIVDKPHNVLNSPPALCA